MQSVHHGAQSLHPHSSASAPHEDPCEKIYRLQIRASYKFMSALATKAEEALCALSQVVASVEPLADALQDLLRLFVLRPLQTLPLHQKLLCSCMHLLTAAWQGLRLLSQLPCSHS